jgi:hypothetical protein
MKPGNSHVPPGSSGTDTQRVGTLTMTLPVPGFRPSRASWAHVLAIAVLTLSVALSPRFTVGTLAYGKNVDIRIEDVLIVPLALLVARRPRLPGPLTGILCAYFAVGCVSTMVGALVGWVEPLRAVLYFAKEAELVAYLAIALAYLQSVTTVRAVVSVLLLGGLINGIYVLEQVRTGNYLGLKEGYYGVALIGEATPFTVSAYFGMMVLLGLAATELPGWWTKAAGLFCIGSGGVGVIAGMSRASVVAGTVVLGVWFALKLGRGGRNRSRLLGIAALAIVIAAAGASYSKLLNDRDAPLAIRRIGDLLTGDAQQTYQKSRVDDVYINYVDPILRNPLFGLGKSITGTDLPIEAHNYYLRVVAEEGLLGLAFFCAALVYILRVSWRLQSRGIGPWQRAIGQWCLLSTVFLSITALAQDTFIVVRIAEMFWLMVAVALRSEQWRCQRIAF